MTQAVRPPYTAVRFTTRSRSYRRCFKMAIPVAAGIAILKHRLYDLDLVVNRTAVYGGLTACVIATYVAVVGVLGVVFQQRGGLGASLVATGLVAVLFQPLRERLQRAVNRLLYGDRAEPYAA